MQRIAFVGVAGHSRYSYSGALPQCDGLPRSAGTGLENILELYDLTDNKGNMIHGEAPARILRSDRGGSCYVSARALVEAGWSAERVSEELSERFDLVVFSMANAIRPGVNPGAIAQIMGMLRAEFVVLGLGTQNPLARTTEQLHPKLIEMLGVCNRKATVFGVRGLETEKWLRSVGFDRARALGCPSMYVYPENIMNIVTPDPSRVASAITGGHIHGRVPRSSAIIQLFRGFDAHYVMQEEMHAWEAQGLLDPAQKIYNDATGEVRREVVNSILEDIHDEPMPFSSYRWFQDPNAWRAFASRFDFYLGDRLHGGVVAMQVGIPAVIVAEDMRVIEATDYFGVPRIGIEVMETRSLKEILSDHLAKEDIASFKEIYMERFRNFEATLGDVGIALTVGEDLAKPSMSERSRIPSNAKKPGFIRRVRRLLRRF